MAFDRRAMLKTAVSAATAAAATPGFAMPCQVGPAPHDKGAKVWMDLDQIELGEQRRLQIHVAADLAAEHA